MGGSSSSLTSSGSLEAGSKWLGGCARLSLFGLIYMIMNVRL